MKLIIEFQYFPTVIFYKNSIGFSHIIFDQYENYRKMSFRNRCVVAGSNGPITLSVPLEEGRDQRGPIKDVRVANRQNWQRHHWTTITSCYNRSPWFEFYRSELEALYQRPVEFLVDWDLRCFELMRQLLNWPVEISITESYKPAYEPGEAEDWRNRFLPATIRQDFSKAPRYRQVFEERLGFIPHLSVLDLLCCEGAGAGAILRGE